ncbi:MAG: bifunctional [glutamate--ammonia ligase]-adenylyl-L-tyrosine phosphorylase/[glutamate--ammonia-ligase] adenylyltransferase [Desulfobacterales bacterium]|nr:bifunctional [glutamate--ammonia ligase]-adenylyl-L-tyrosine phosphorylase/[glutamate--ammonia-ligase] adenylyltransferase [Desulfobacterales bacterium]
MHPSEKHLDSDIEQRWQAFQTAARHNSLPLPAEAAIRAEIRRVLGFSDFIARHASQTPAWVTEILQSGDLDRTIDRPAYARRLDRLMPAASDITDDELAQALRAFRRQEMLRIAWRDLSGRAALDEILSELSHLADVCIKKALEVLHAALARTHGQPTGADGRPLRLLVIGMGKLGARELNFSSDVDLIFAFAQGGHTSGGDKSISNDDFFTRLARRLIQALGQVRADGFVFRVDTGLRPFGESGPLAMSFYAMETYYQTHGREWERYAWIKARVVAGDDADARSLMAMMRPFVYRRYLDYGVFESLREMKNKIALEVRRKGMTHDVKLGPGGIREVEFFAQFFQLIRGGVVPALQEPRLMPVLDVLAQNGYITADVRGRLCAAYIFLRRVEHRLQAFADQQTHRLPTETLERARLARSMGFDDTRAFDNALDQHRDWVHRQFATLLADEDEPPSADDAHGIGLDVFNGIWQEALDAEQADDLLGQAGFASPPDVRARLVFLRRQAQRTKISAEARRRLDRLLPQMLQTAARAKAPDRTVTRIIDILAGIGRRSTYLALLAENPPALQHLVQLAGASHFIAALIARRPVLLDELLDPRTLYTPPEKAELIAELRTVVAKTPPDDLEFLIESICIFRQVNTLRVAAADVTGVLPLMRVSDHLTDLAEVILHEVVGLAWNHLVARHGRPSGPAGDSPFDQGFAVVAYGKLGGFELGYGSDLDLVFLHGADPGYTANGPQPIDNRQFFSRLGQRVIHILTTHTRAGRIYETDMRLRPSGSAGPLVSHIEAYAKYLREEAWTWEHQALIRARVVCGNQSMHHRFNRIRREILERPREQARLQAEIVDMREKLRKEQNLKAEDVFDLKQGRGGIVDIEFLVQFMILGQSHRFPALTAWTDNVRLLVALIDSGLLEPEAAYFLREAYLIFRAAAHRLSLQNQPARVEATRFAKPRQRVRRYWQRFLAP